MKTINAINTINTKMLSLLIGAALVLPAAGALAYPFGRSWHDRADGNPSNGGRAGAGGIYGTGGQTDYGITCAHCHIGAQGKIDVQNTPTPAWQMVNNQAAYKPGQTYQITLNMLNEWKGLNQMNNNLNGFAATFENQSGKVAGTLISDSGVDSGACPANYPANNPATTTYVYGDCHAVLYVPHPNTTSWSFSWKAPAAGAGQVTLFYSVVDGDHADKSSLDDDVKSGTVKLVEGN